MQQASVDARSPNKKHQRPDRRHQSDQQHGQPGIWLFGRNMPLTVALVA